jgi:hypothetical protein
VRQVIPKLYKPDYDNTGRGIFEFVAVLLRPDKDVKKLFIAERARQERQAKGKVKNN